jgi:uncharacterized protein (DUF2267 family)
MKCFSGGGVMSATGLQSIDHTVQLTHSWINDLDHELGWNNKARSYRLMRSVLHAVRDWLQVDESANLAAQMPMLVRGIYYDQWRPATTPVKERSKADFLARIEKDFHNDPLSDSSKAVEAVFRLLNGKITAGEVADVRHSLPGDLRSLWPESGKAG